MTTIYISQRHAYLVGIAIGIAIGFGLGMMVFG